MEGNKLVWHLICKKPFALNGFALKYWIFLKHSLKVNTHMECRLYLLKHCKYLLQCKYFQRALILEKCGPKFLHILQT